VKPKMPATTDTRKKISAHFRIVMVCPPAFSTWQPSPRATLI
jgi:hypothetical protein